MKTDIQIAQEAKLLPIKEIAQEIGMTEDDLELYGKYKAKISDDFYEKIKDNKDGKLILVTAINPTPAGEGKTTTSVGLGQAFGKLNKKAIIALREPSLGPCFGIKGGAAGGGYAPVTGTSFAAPFVTGGAALLMEWGIVKGEDPYLYSEKVKAYLRRGAKPLPGFDVYPNPQVGYGALCVENSLPM